jgi:hypothetical protein
MPDSSIQVNIRLAPADVERLRALQKRLQAAHGPSVVITPKVVLLEALAALEVRYDRLERDRSRPR